MKDPRPARKDRRSVHIQPQLLASRAWARADHVSRDWNITSRGPEVGAHNHLGTLGPSAVPIIVRRFSDSVN